MDGKYLTFGEKVREFRASRILDYENIKERTMSGKVEEDFDRGRIVGRRDLRAELRAAIKESGISQRQVAFFLGMTSQQLNGYLNYRMKIAYDRLEEVLFLLDCKVLKREDAL